MFNCAVTGIMDEMSFCNSYPIHKACREGDVQTVTLVLESHTNISIMEDPFKSWTPIHWAASCGHLDCLRQVASFDPTVINIQSSKTFQTPLHCASEAGHPHCVLWLLQVGANPEVKDISGETALHKASRMGNAECVSLLLATSCNISVRNSSGHTASDLAEMCGYPAIAAFICKNGLSQMGESQNNCVLQPSLTAVRFSRKRTRDAMGDDISFKRLRSEDIASRISPTLPQNTFFNPVTTSVVEHEKLCRMECGYANSFVECMFNEFHGC